ncbi:MAG: hypothetical protein HYU53_01045 [Acidobacteria bacterium]|nr:hypothetical protein [Acidobacteriota bacterium]
MADDSSRERLRLKDRIAPGVRVLFVGINPGVRSAITGHHFAGYSNRFWKLLHESRLVREPISYKDDVRLPGWGSIPNSLTGRTRKPPPIRARSTGRRTSRGRCSRRTPASTGRET